MKTLARKYIAHLCAFAVALTTSLAPAHAAMLPPSAGDNLTSSIQAGTNPRAQVTEFLAREEVREQMRSLGVAPEEIDARIASMSEHEVQELAARIDSAPAGAGVLGVLGIVFVVLLVLEILGVTNVFTSVGPAHSN